MLCFCRVERSACSYTSEDEIKSSNSNRSCNSIEPFITNSQLPKSNSYINAIGFLNTKISQKVPEIQKTVNFQEFHQKIKHSDSMNSISSTNSSNFSMKSKISVTEEDSGASIDDNLSKNNKNSINQKMYQQMYQTILLENWNCV